MGEVALDRMLNQLWSEFYTEAERAITERTVSIHWENIENPHHKIAFLYAAASALSREHREKREDQLERFRFDRLEEIAVRVEGMRIEQRDRLFDQYVELERERQAAFVSLSREWMDRQQEIIEHYGLNKKAAQSRHIGYYKELPPETIDVSAQITSTPSTVVQVSNPLLMNCNYAKSGPTNCVSERQEADGVYRMCSIGQQIRSRIRLPHLLTSVYNQTGCPSNPLGPFRCVYIKYEKVKVG